MRDYRLVWIGFILIIAFQNCGPNSFRAMDLQNTQSSSNFSGIEVDGSPGSTPPSPSLPDFTGGVSPVVDTLPGQPNLKQAPEQLDNTFKYNANSSANLLTFDHPDGRTVQLFAYYAANRRLHIVERDFPDGDWGTPVDIHSAANGSTSLELDSHNYIALGICPQTGHIFVANNMHVDPLRMTKSAQPYSITSGWNNFAQNQIKGEYYRRITYPAFSTVGLGADERLVLSQRDQLVGSGIPRFKTAMMIFNEDATELTQIPFTTGASLRLYTSSVVRDDATGTIHLAGTWRDESLGTSNFKHYDLFHIYSPNGRDWYQYERQEKLQLPLIWDEFGRNWRAGVDGLPRGYPVPHNIWKTTEGAPHTWNAVSLNLDENGFPHIIFQQESGRDVWHAHFNGNSWSTRKLNFNVDSAASFVHNDTQALLYVDGNHVRYRSLIQGNPYFNEPLTLASGFTNSDSNATIDFGAYKRGWLSFMLIPSDSHRVGTTGVNRDDEVFSLSLPLDEITSTETYR